MDVSYILRSKIFILKEYNPVKSLTNIVLEISEGQSKILQAVKAIDDQANQCLEEHVSTGSAIYWKPKKEPITERNDKSFWDMR